MKESILLLNMGGPNHLEEVELFLKNMFNDKAIINAPWFIRKFIASKIVKSRLEEAVNNYKALGGKSPIVGHTRTLVEELTKVLDKKVSYIMRYTPPFAKDVLKEIKDYDRFYVIPLYPHYSRTTTESSLDDFLKAARSLRISPEKIEIIDRFYNNEIYNRLIVKRIKEVLGGDNAKDFELIFSAHGLPQDIIDKGDPYMKHIKQNVFRARKELLREGLFFKGTHLAYQSRVGPKEWIKPYLEDKLKSIKSKKVIIYPIAFLVDNSETEFELCIEYKEIADKLGFEDYRVAKSLNELLKDLIIDLYRRMSSIDDRKRCHYSIKL